MEPTAHNQTLADLDLKHQHLLDELDGLNQELDSVLLALTGKHESETTD